MLLAQEGPAHPFDVTTFAGHHWTLAMNEKERRKAFLAHWNAIRSRPPVVPDAPLIS
jgi:hypothetical protein